MSEERKNAEAREKDLRMAILRIKRGRSHTGAKSVSIASVAREAGVSPALIHNHYPAVAEAIRIEQGRDGRVERDAKRQKLREEQAKSRELRRLVGDLETKVARLSSLNEVLLADNAALRSKLAGGKVTAIHVGRRVPR